MTYGSNNTNTNSSSKGSQSSNSSFLKESAIQIGNYVVEDLSNKAQRFQVYLAEKKALRLQKQELKLAEERFNKEAIRRHKKYVLRKQLAKKNLHYEDSKQTAILETKSENAALQTEIKNAVVVQASTGSQTQSALMSKENLLATKAEHHEFLLDFFKRLALIQDKESAVALETKTTPEQDFVAYATDFEKNTNSNLTTNLQHRDFQFAEAKFSFEQPKLEGKEKLSKGFCKQTNFHRQHTLDNEMGKLTLRPRNNVVNANFALTSEYSYNMHTSLSPSLSNNLSQEMPFSSFPLFLHSPGFFIAATGVTLKLAVSNSKNKVVELAIMGTYSNVIKVVNLVKTIPKKLINIRGGYKDLPEVPQLKKDEFLTSTNFEKVQNNERLTPLPDSNQDDFSDLEDLNFVFKEQEQNKIYHEIPYQPPVPSFYKQEQDRRNKPKWKKPNKVDIALKIAWDYLLKIFKLLLLLLSRSALLAKTYKREIFWTLFVPIVIWLSLSSIKKDAKANMFGQHMPSRKDINRFLDLRHKPWFDGKSFVNFGPYITNPEYRDLIKDQIYDLTQWSELMDEYVKMDSHNKEEILEMTKETAIMWLRVQYFNYRIAEIIANMRYSEILRNKPRLAKKMVKWIKWLFYDLTPGGAEKVYNEILDMKFK